MQNRLPNLDHIKQIDGHGHEYWSARSLIHILGYGEGTWSDFERVIQRARCAYIQAGISLEDHFRSALKTVKSDSENGEEILDYFLSRRACYLIIMNGDVHKPGVASVQNHIAFTAEVLNGNWSVPISVEAIDTISPEVLAANLFHTTQTNAKLKRDEVSTETRAIATHHDVGVTVREAIEKIHQRKPEDLPREENIRKLVEAERRKEKRRIQNKPPDAQDGLF